LPRSDESKPESLPDKARRLTLLGRTERDVRLLMFAEGWRQKVEQNAPFELLQRAKTGPYVNPLVTVALRRDGTLESVEINRSSGIQAIDDAVRQILLMLSPYDAIPPEIAMDYDVIEIVRVWTFDAGLRLVYGRR
jgi:outer membrane biosynthesis protein TonB